MPVKPIPDGFHTATPYLIARSAASAIDFYIEAFGASERYRIAEPDGRVAHAEFRVGDSIFMIADARPERGRLDPIAMGGSPVGLMLYVEDVDAVVAKAVEAGAKLDFPVVDQFYGDRMGGVTDPFGHVWYIATHIEDVPHEEVIRRAAAEPQPA